MKEKGTECHWEGLIAIPEWTVGEGQDLHECLRSKARLLQWNRMSWATPDRGLMGDLCGRESSPMFKAGDQRCLCHRPMQSSEVSRVWDLRTDSVQDAGLRLAMQCHSVTHLWSMLWDPYKEIYLVTWSDFSLCRTPPQKDSIACVVDEIL